MRLMLLAVLLIGCRDDGAIVQQNYDDPWLDVWPSFITMEPTDWNTVEVWSVGTVRNRDNATYTTQLPYLILYTSEEDARANRVFREIYWGHLGIMDRGTYLFTENDTIHSLEVKDYFVKSDPIGTDQLPNGIWYASGVRAKGELTKPAQFRRIK